MNQCDHDHDTMEETRLLPLSDLPLHGNIIVCRRHYDKEMRYRRETGWTFLPSWDSLEVYAPAPESLADKIKKGTA